MKISFKSDVCRTRDSSVVRLKNGEFLEVRNGLWTWGRVPYFDGGSSKEMKGIPVRLIWASFDKWLGCLTTTGSFFANDFPLSREDLTAVINAKKGTVGTCRLRELQATPAPAPAPPKEYSGIHHLILCDDDYAGEDEIEACGACGDAIRKDLEKFLTGLGFKKRWFHSKNHCQIEFYDDPSGPLIDYSFKKFPAGWTGGDPMKGYSCNAWCDECGLRFPSRA